MVFNTCKSLINQIFSRESSFRSIIPETLQKFERFIRYIVSKEHLSAFVYFLTILILTKKKQIQTRDQFLKVFKEKFTISQNSSINSKVKQISCFSEVDGKFGDYSSFYGFFERNCKPRGTECVSE